MNNIFHFKEFKIDQSDCAMKVNTDGVLLAALVQAKNPQRILDVGTGTGLISLMLAQRFETASIDAVEIDEKAAKRKRRESPYCA
jgi:tRNA1Val (adenine37-N6)-methyltransferase